MVLVPGLAVGGFTVGMSSDLVLALHPPEDFRFACMTERGRNTCFFMMRGVEGNAMFEFVVGGHLRGRLDGSAAYAFFRGKPLLGVKQLSRLD